MARSIKVEILGDPSSLEKALKRAHASSTTFQKQTEVLDAKIKGLHSRMFSLTTAMIGSGGLVFGLKEVIDAAKEAQLSQDHLAVAMKDAGLSYQAHKKHIEGVIAAQMKLSAFDDEDLRNSFTKIVTATKDVNKSLELNQLAADIARARHIDLGAATNIVIKAQEGMVGQLRRMGIDIPKVTTAQDQLRDAHVKVTSELRNQAKALDDAATKQRAIAALQQTYAGQAKAYGESAAGASDRFNVAVQNLKESIGAALLPELNKALVPLAAWAQKMADSGKAQRAVRSAIKDATPVFAEMRDVVKGLFHGYKDFADAIGGNKNAFMVIAGALTGAKFAAALSNLGLLNKRLGVLKGIGPTLSLTIGIEILIHRQSIKDAVDQALINARNFVHDQEAKVGLGFLTPRINDFGGGKSIGGGDFASTPTIAANNAQAKKAKQIVATAQSQLGIPYQYGGPAVLGQHTDCSGLAQAVLRKSGINIPRTSQQQWNSGRPVDLNHLQPGDLVFYEMGDGGPHHVAIYIGGGQIIEDPHTGASVQQVSINYPGRPVGARRYIKNIIGGSGGGGGGSDTTTTTSDTSGGKLDLSHAQSSTKAKIIKGASLLSNTAQTALVKAGRTSGTADDLAALGAAKDELENKLKGATGAQRVAIENELTAIQKKINAINTKSYRDEMKKLAQATKQHLATAKKEIDAAKSRFESAFRFLASQALNAFDKETESHLKSMQITVSGGFDSFLFGGSVTQTPTEAKLAKLRADRAKASRDAAIASATSDLEKAQAAGDPEAIKQAQEALSSAQLDAEEAGLQDQADLERKAADDQLTTAQQNYQDLRAIQRDQLSAWLDEQEKNLEAGKTKWGDFWNELITKAALGGASSAGAFWDAFNAAGGPAGDAFGDLGAAKAKAAAITGGATAVAAGIVPGTVAAAAAAGKRITHALPKFASGGYAPRPTVAIVGDSPGGEYMVPAAMMAALRAGSKTYAVDVHNYGREVTVNDMRRLLRELEILS